MVLGEHLHVVEDRERLPRVRLEARRVAFAVDARRPLAELGLAELFLRPRRLGRGEEPVAQVFDGRLEPRRIRRLRVDGRGRGLAVQRVDPVDDLEEFFRAGGLRAVGLRAALGGRVRGGVVARRRRRRERGADRRRDGRREAVLAARARSRYVLEDDDAADSVDRGRRGGLGEVRVGGDRRVFRRVPGRLGAEDARRLAALALEHRRRAVEAERKLAARVRYAAVEPALVLGADLVDVRGVAVGLAVAEREADGEELQMVLDAAGRQLEAVRGLEADFAGLVARRRHAAVAVRVDRERRERCHFFAEGLDDLAVRQERRARAPGAGDFAARRRAAVVEAERVGHRLARGGQGDRRDQPEDGVGPHAWQISFRVHVGSRPSTLPSARHADRRSLGCARPERTPNRSRSTVRACLRAPCRACVSSFSSN
mmetsp:Transcript_13789/g.42725  ORF Transcript_13789/g.42725 Transcript_13789/m.42725 type:complete len:428 (-) Transcript_13789:108-1391(-)